MPEGKEMRTGKDKKELSKLKKWTAGTLVALSCIGSYHLLKAAVAATATLPIMARLVRAIEVTVNTSLDFGTLAMTVERAGEATIDPGLNKLVIDNSSSLALAGGTPRVGRISIKGAAFPVAVSVEKSTVNLTNGVTTVTVNRFNFLTANGGSRITITPSAGNFSFTVPIGATLLTKPGQLEGTYVGSTRIFANFQ